MTAGRPPADREEARSHRAGVTPGLIREGRVVRIAVDIYYASAGVLGVGNDYVVSGG